MRNLAKIQMTPKHVLPPLLPGLLETAGELKTSIDPESTV